MTESLPAVQDWVGDEVEGLLPRHRVPGLAVGIADRAGPIWSAGFGTTARDGGHPVSPETIFSLQSISKMYTATAVMCAVADGLVDLDAAVTTYLPEFTVHSDWEPEPQSQITLRHLLSHRTGLVHEAPRGSNFNGDDDSFDDHCASISDTALQFRVGERYAYSNLGIDLAAWVLQRMSGLAFPAYLDRVLLGPLDLRRTTFDPARIAAEPDRATGHVETGPPALRVPMIGAAGGYASVDDVLRYAAFHLNSGSGVLAPERLEQMYHLVGADPDQQVGYGLGIHTSRRNGRLVRNHGGGGFGFLCDLVWDPATGVAVVVLTNSEDHPFQLSLSTDILDLVSPMTMHPRPTSPQHRTT